MKIGELFVQLGLTGSDKAKKEIKDVKGGLKETASASLEAKAAIVGAMYALQRLFSASNQAGTDLTNFNAQIGVSAQTLQQYQYAAQQVGVSNQEMAGTFKSLQSTMTKTLMGEGAPKGLARVAMLTGGMTPADLEKFAKQPQLLVQKLQEYAQKETNAGLRNEVLKGFGISDSMAAALSRNAFRPEVLAKAPTYSDKEINALDKTHAAWSNLGTKIEMTIGRFNAKHGGKLIEDISNITDKVFLLGEAFMKMAEKFKVFEWIGKVFEGWAIILDTVTTLADGVDAPEGSAKKIKSDEIKGGFKEALNWMLERKFLPDEPGKTSGYPQFDTSKPMFQWGASKTPNSPVKSPIKPSTGPMVVPQERPFKVLPGGGQKSETEKPITPPTLKVIPGQSHAPGVPAVKDVVPKMPAQAAAGGNQVSITNEFNQEFNFSDGVADPQATADSVKRSVQQAFRQSFAQSQWS